MCVELTLKSLEVTEEIKRSDINIIKTTQYFNEKKQKFIQGKPEGKNHEYQGGEVKKIHYNEPTTSKSNIPTTASATVSHSNGGINNNNNSGSSGNNSHSNVSALLSDSQEDHHRLPHSVKVRFESSETNAIKRDEKKQESQSKHTTESSLTSKHNSEEGQASTNSESTSANNSTQSAQGSKQKFAVRLRRNTLIQFNYLAHENLFNYTHEAHLIHEKIRSFFEVGLDCYYSSFSSRLIVYLY
jgi:hypothetical protein